MTDLIEFDRQHLWHPYTSMVDPLPAYHVVGAEGVELTLADGRKLIDGMASWWCVIHGYNRPELNAAITEQLEKMAHVMFGGLTHEPAVGLAERLIGMSPPGLEQVFLSDSGSIAVEVAIKMAIQYWGAKGRPEKSRLLTVEGAYHGDTFGAMSVCDPVNGMHERFTSVLPQHVFAPRPEARPGESLTDQDRGIRALFVEHHEELAAVIVEPLVQGAGGMWFYSVAYLQLLRELCDEFDVLLILDEIATGFGRTGELFACQHANRSPDIMCLGKAMTGGYLTQAATLTNTKVAQGLSEDGGVLMHGPTFMANPLSCAVACASIDLLLQSDWQGSVKAIESQLATELGAYRDHPAVEDVRTFGAIGVIQTSAPVPVADLQEIFVDEGVWIRPFSDLIYLMPPYVISASQLTRLTQAMGKALDSLIVA
ncbi:MAG: adenosylmethionine--8-amino-7-oxononanoate transaminase [Gammaproteobacteria bacterium]|nr:adenosylmethionine--8-amino-7-oxononanoate transaminase [Gammaproteobacteria bacterium]RPG25685.1 MAG: adenosylmethionine--8-amino-7-oxononanoate transaminase [Gammaproteobacteria bacterium TMED50]|tara:strand:+ start:13933 stop:15210 length:1278 start_codon:yes stop_codon:yes gene_type:complete